MKKFWTFGDSFCYENGGWDNRYFTWKGYVPKTHHDIISENFNFKQINLSNPGDCNDTIFENFMKNIKNIHQDDIIQFGWVALERFRLATANGKWSRIMPAVSFNYIEGIDGKFENISQKTIEEILINRTNPIYRKELMNKIEFINSILPKNKIIHWTWSDSFERRRAYQTVKDETGGEINDFHWSENGQKEFGKWIIEKINDDILHYVDMNQII